MTTTDPPSKRTPKRTKTAPSSEKTTPDQGKQPPRKRTQPASNAVKVVRKGRKPLAGDKLQRELAWPEADAAAKSLLTQVGRVADRLEVIARLLSGDAGEWLAVRVSGQVLEVRVSDLVREERQQSEVLRKLIMDIQRLRAESGGGKGGGEPKVDRVAEIVAKHYGGKRS